MQEYHPTFQPYVTSPLFEPSPFRGACGDLPCQGYPGVGEIRPPSGVLERQGSYSESPPVVHGLSAIENVVSVGTRTSNTEYRFNLRTGEVSSEEVQAIQYSAVEAPVQIGGLPLPIEDYSVWQPEQIHTVIEQAQVYEQTVYADPLANWQVDQGYWWSDIPFYEPVESPPDVVPESQTYVSPYAGGGTFTESPVFTPPDAISQEQITEEQPVTTLSDIGNFLIDAAQAFNELLHGAGIWIGGEAFY